MGLFLPIEEVKTVSGNFKHRVERKLNYQIIDSRRREGLENIPNFQGSLGKNHPVNREWKNADFPDFLRPRIRTHVYTYYTLDDQKNIFTAHYPRENKFWSTTHERDQIFFSNAIQFHQAFPHSIFGFIDAYVECGWGHSEFLLTKDPNKTETIIRQ